jgi:hypothetical protein
MGFPAPLEIRRFGVSTYVNHFSSRVCLLVIISYRDGVEFAHTVIPFRIQLGYFQAMALPVSTCVQDIFVPSHKYRAEVTKL